MDARYREEDLKGAALLLSERSLLMGACVIFYIIFCTHGELINFPLLESLSEDRLCQNFDVTLIKIKIGLCPHVPLEL